MSLLGNWAARAPADFTASGDVVLHEGDCLEVLKRLPDSSIDSVVTDPPYHLQSIVKRFGAVNAASAKASETGVYARSSRGFMGKVWDGGDIAFRVELWAEVLRVLKPGGHVAAFSGTRTYHRMACAIEDAGFEIRDQLAWVFGSGFPKSLDISKAIDKAGGVSPRDQAALLKNKREVSGLSRDVLASIVGCTASSIRDWEEGRARAAGAPIEWLAPSECYRMKLADALGYSSDERCLIYQLGDQRKAGAVYELGHTGSIRSGGHTTLAAKWAGFGTALKPAWEPICLARKPLIGTNVENILLHGTGSLNINGCRVGMSDEDWERLTEWHGKYGDCNYAHNEVLGEFAEKRVRPPHAQGRWPANFVHDGSDEVIASFPSPHGAGVARMEPGGGAYAGSDKGDWGNIGKGRKGFRIGDSGSAARFFYAAKASKADRAGSKHPTVKPISLMRWLVRLITPPGGTALDMFAGSGTTGQAAREEGFTAVLVEREAEYVADIKRRLGLRWTTSSRC